MHANTYARITISYWGMSGGMIMAITSCIKTAGSIPAQASGFP